MTDTVSDWRTFSTPHAIERVEAAGEGVALTWSDGRRTRHHRFWLRDNCACPQCYLALTREQMFEIVDAPADLAVADARRRRTGGWRCAGRTGTPASTSPAGCGRMPAMKLRGGNARRTRQAGSVGPGIRRPAAILRLRRDSGRRRRAARLADGFALDRPDAGHRRAGRARGAAASRSPASAICARPISAGCSTSGRSRPADSAAYTSVNLPPHTDLPTRELQPGVQFLHCLVNDATGGESVFVDGFAIGEAMRREAPERVPPPDDDAHGVLEPRFPHRLPLERADPGARRAGRDGGGALRQFPARAGRRGRGRTMGAIYEALRLFQAMAREPSGSPSSGGCGRATCGRSTIAACCMRGASSIPAPARAGCRALMSTGTRLCRAGGCWSGRRGVGE